MPLNIIFRNKDKVLNCTIVLAIVAQNDLLRLIHKAFWICKSSSYIFSKETLTLTKMKLVNDVSLWVFPQMLSFPLLARQLCSVSKAV